MEKNITLTDRFWGRYRELVRTEMIPYQWKVLSDSIDINIEKERDDDYIPNEKSHAIENFKIAAGRSKGHHYGWMFQDSDVYKWLEAVAYSLADKYDEELKNLADSVVTLIGEAQEPDGYLSTFFTIEAPKRKFLQLGESHELYCMGHFLEAGAAYYNVTKSQAVFEISEKLVNCLFEYFGFEEGKHAIADGHEEIEIGLAKWYEATGNMKALTLAKFFLDVRGLDPLVYDKQRKDPAYHGDPSGMARLPKKYYQIHKPVNEQDTAEGHAVRMLYLATAMADVAAKTGDNARFEACKKIWRNIVDTKMFITGGVGSTVHGESFTFEYDLPNDTMYCETCASVALTFFARKMLENEIDSEYADIMETALYNTAIAGMALDGKHFFYVNPLEVNPVASRLDPGKSHVKAVRPSWLGCACCPPNLARLVTSVENYIYTKKEDRLYVNLFIGNTAEFNICGNPVSLEIKTGYPWSGDVTITVNNAGNSNASLGVRVPGWHEEVTYTMDNSEITPDTEKGYAVFEAKPGKTTIVMRLDMIPCKYTANPKVSADAGKVAIKRGPLVYCLEGVDNGDNLAGIYLDDSTSFVCSYEKEVLGGVCTIECDGLRIKEETGLYKKYTPASFTKQHLKFIPYFAWANRGENEMRVWVNQK